jgi:hypothetical protein
MEAPSGGSSKPGLPRRSHGEGGSFGSGFFTYLQLESHWKERLDESRQREGMEHGAEDH